MARYALPPNWEGFTDRDLASGDTLLEALANARVFSVSKTGDNYCIEESCDDYFNAVLTPKQLYDLGMELQVLAAPYVDRFETKDLAEVYISLLLRYSTYGKEYN